MERAARFIEAMLPLDAVRAMGLSRAVGTFAVAMRDQVDLRVEAKNLDTFRNNFSVGTDKIKKVGLVEGDETEVKFPQPVKGWVDERVLVQSLEDDAVHISAYVADNTPEGLQRRAEIAGLLLTSFLKMVFTDNFVHCDLHPGNILVRENLDGGGNRTIIILDAGLVTSLSPLDRRDLVDLFQAVVLNNGALAGRLMVERARYEKCSTVPGCTESFSAGVQALVQDFHNSRREDGLTLGAVQIGSLLRRMLDLCRAHGVEINPSMANIVVSTLVLEGLGRSLDSELNLIECAIPFILGSVGKSI
uniref:ABC1 atypical kinase-like domain-containing protein n=1 Tax=Corethron hystrix TaxID=216773 RepID=A0A7S1FR00_9STRA|mmetsp:Transcript_24359/g.55616  ORF Transcript_24359/g.55616 Transcript_24359/m.55616 type:complete len:304 (+) Transcript_24359:1299-2210(+)